MKQKVEALEHRLRLAEERAQLSDEVRRYLSDLEKLPENAVLTYTEYGMRISHQVGKSFRVLLERLK